MSRTDTRHPTVDVLQAFALGQLAAPVLEAIDEHLASCTDCQSIVASVGPDPFLAGLRQAFVPGSRSTSGFAAAPTPIAQATPVPAQTPAPQLVRTLAEPPFPVATGAPQIVPGYDVVEEIGHGGMGVVFRACQAKLNRTVALKMIRGGGFASPQLLARFRQEAQALAQMQHPNIVQIFDVGEQDGQPYFSMEFVDGGNLAALLAEAPLKPADAARLVETLARAMFAAHERNVIHRDLKPGNVLLQSTAGEPSPVRGRVTAEVPSSPGPLRGTARQEFLPKITDFGLAKQLDRDSSQTKSDVILGTPSYMAPEQAIGNPQAVGPAADIYALGAILYECLTGRPPFRGATPMETVRQVIDEEPVAPRRLQPNVPANLETICLKCLRKEPRQRYATAHDLADDLRRFTNHEPILARPVGWTERLFLWARRNKAVASLTLAVATILVLAVVGLSVAFVIVNSAKNKEQESVVEKDNALVKLGTALDKEEKARIKAQNAEAQEKESRQKAEGLQKDEAIARKKAEDAKKLAEEKEKEATSAANEARRQIARMFGNNAARLQESGDVLASLPWLVEAAAASPDKEREEEHLVRLTTALRISPRLEQILRHRGAVVHVEFSPDGKKLLTASWDSTACVWDAATGKRLCEFRHKSAVTHAAFSPDGTRVATVSNDRTACVWDVATGKAITPPLQLGSPGTHVTFSPDGKLVAASGGDKNQTSSTVTGPPVMIPIPQGAGKPPIMVPQAGAPIMRQPHGRAQVWDAVTGQPVTPRGFGHLGWMNYVAFDADGVRLVTAGSTEHGQSVIMVWDAKTGARTTTAPPLPAPGVPRNPNDRTREALYAAFSPDGKQIVTAGFGRRDIKGGGAFFWDAATGQPMGEPLEHGREVMSARFSPDGKRIVTASWDRTARVWDAATGRPIGSALQHGDRVADARFSADSRHVLTSSWDFTARMWDVITGTPASPPLRHGGPVLSGAISPDGRLVATADWDGVVKVWDLATDTLARRPVGHPLPTVWAQLDADGHRLFTATGIPTSLTSSSGSLTFRSQHMDPEALWLWDLDTGKQLVRLPVRAGHFLESTRAPYAVSPTGKQVAIVAPTAERETSAVSVLDAKDGKAIFEPVSFPEKVIGIGFAATGTCQVATLEQMKEGGRLIKKWSLQLWQVDGGKRRTVVPRFETTVAIDRAIFSTDGRQVLLAMDDKSIGLFDVTRNGLLGEPIRLSGMATAVAISPDGQRVVAVARKGGIEDARDFEVILWEPASRTIVPLKHHRDLVNHVAFSTDGKLVLTSSDDRTARTWNAADGKPVSPPLTHQGGIAHASFSPDGRWVATAGLDQTARVWNAVTGEPITPPLPHQENVRHASFSANGKLLVTAAEDGQVYVWNLQPQEKCTRDDLALLARVRAGGYIDETGGLTPLDPAQLAKDWQTAREGVLKDRVATAEPVVRWHLAQVHQALHRCEWAAAVIHLDRLIGYEPKEAVWQSQRGELLARLRRWEQAREAAQAAIALGSQSVADNHRLLLLHLQAGDEAAYRKHGRTLLAGFDPKDTTPHPVAALVWDLVLADGAADDPAQLVALAQQPAPATERSIDGAVIQRNPRQLVYSVQPSAAARQMDSAIVLGAAFYRAGKHADAIAKLEEASKRSGRYFATTGKLFLAMAYQKADRKEEAKKLLEEAREASADDERRWETEIELNVLRKEAEGVVR